MQDVTMLSAALDLKLLPSPHTGEAIGKLVKETLTEWGITDNTPIGVTDSGASMIKGLKVVNQLYLDEEAPQKPAEADSFACCDSSESDESEGNKYLVLLYILIDVV